MSHLAYRLRIPLHHLLMGVLLISTLLPAAILSGRAEAATRTWDGGGTTNNWSDCANWSSDTCPVAGDIATFNNTSTKNAVVDAGFDGTIATMNIANTYTGTVSQSRSLTLSGNFQQTGGTFTADSQALSITGGLSISGGSFTASSATTTISAGLAISGSTAFNANGGTVNFNSTSGTRTLACNNVLFSLVTFTHTGGGYNVNSDCNLPLGSDPTLGNSTGNFTLNGTLSGTGTLFGGGGTKVLSSGGALSGFTGLSMAALTINGTYDFGSYTTFGVTGTFTLNSGAVFTAPSGTASFAGSFTINSGSTFNANGGTVDFTGVSNATLSCNSVAFHLVTFTNTNGTKTANSNCSLPLGNDPTVGAGGAVALNGTLSGSGTLTKSTGTLTLNGGGALSGFSGLSAITVSVNGTYDFGSYDPFTVTSTFTINSGAMFTAPTGTASFGGNFTIDPGSTFNANGGTVNFNGTGTGALNCNNAVFTLVTFTHTAGTKTVGSNCSLPLSNDPDANSGGPISLNGTLSGTGTLTTASTFTLGATGVLSGFSGLSANGLTVNGTYDFGAYTTFSSGTFNLNSGAVFTAPAGIASFGGASFTINSGATFNANGGTVNFNRASSSGTISCGNAVFHLVTFTNAGTLLVSNGCNLPLGNDPTISTNGNITVEGTLSGSGTLTRQAGVLTLNSGGSLSGFTGLTAGGTLTINGTYDFSGYSTFAANSVFNLNSGAVFTAPTGIASFASSFTINSGATFNANGGTVNFNGAGTFSCNNAVFNLVTINNPSTVTISNNCNFPLGNDPHIGAGGTLILNGTLSGTGTIYHNLGATAGQFNIRDGYALAGFSGLVTDSSLVINTTSDTVNFSGLARLDVGLIFSLLSGTFIAPAGTMTVGSSFSNVSGGTFNANGGTVVLNGGNQSISGSTTFYNLQKTTTSPATLTFQAGSTTTVLGTLTLHGSGSNLLSLVSSLPGSPWFLDAQGAVNIYSVDVADSNNVSQDITVCDSVDSGGNSGWVFNPASCEPEHGGSGANTAVANYAILQAYLANQQAQAKQSQASENQQANMNSGFPDKIREFIKEFPSGKEIANGLVAFLKAAAVGLSIGLLLGLLWWLWMVLGRRRKSDDEDSTNTRDE